MRRFKIEIAKRDTAETGEEEDEEKKPTRCRVAPDSPALLSWRGGPRTSRTPQGMNKKKKGEEEEEGEGGGASFNHCKRIWRSLFTPICKFWTNG